MRGETLGYRHPPWAQDVADHPAPAAQPERAASALALSLHFVVALQALAQIEQIVRGTPKADLAREALSAVEVLQSRLHAIASAVAPPDERQPSG